MPGSSGHLAAAAARFAGVSALALLAAFAPVSYSAHAQSFGGLPVSATADPNAQMLLEADTIIYDNDSSVVTAVGGVQIDYDGNKLVAQRVSYDQKSRRVLASGQVELVQRDGTKINADHVDVTDDFAQGFINALRVETTDKTYFGAESAERSEGDVTTFANGVYTACAPCEEKPDKAPIWRVKAKKIIWNGKEEVVRFERPRFELFGFPIATLPYLEIADPMRKRKTGFLFPQITQNTALGWGVATPFYVALSDTSDLLLTPHYYTNQGFMGEAQFRQKFNNGEYSVKIAGINQRQPAKFTQDPNSAAQDLRYMVGSTGRFEINPRWVFGWDILAQSDKNFSRAYNISGFQQPERVSEAYLTGLNDRNYFDLRFQRFQVQEGIANASPLAGNPRQAWVLPSLDYSRVFDEPVAGGELKLDLNSQTIYRRMTQVSPARTEAQLLGGPTPVGVHDITAIGGLAGTSSRVSAEVEWRRNFVSDAGLVITPLLALRGDGSWRNLNPGSALAVGYMSGNMGYPASSKDSYWRYMATAGLEARWPILVSTATASHVFEPMAQLFVRPDAPYQGELAMANEDSQSMVFDATNLFDRDKFAGWDRIEGGTRANLGLRYTGTYANDWTGHGIFGQSYHLAGANPYAQPDFVNAGAESGLQTNRSDYVGAFTLARGAYFSATVSGRFDKDSFALQRLGAQATIRGKRGSLTASYTDIQAQPVYGLAQDRREAGLAATLKVGEYWSLFGSGTYDTVSKTLVRDAVGFAYDDECFTFRMTVGESRNPLLAKKTVSRSIGFLISFRTLGEFGSSEAVGN